MRNLLGLIAVGLVACGGGSGSATVDGCHHFSADGAHGTIHLSSGTGDFTVEQGAFSAPNPPSSGKVLVSHEADGEIEAQFFCLVSQCGTTNGTTTDSMTRFLYLSNWYGLGLSDC